MIGAPMNLPQQYSYNPRFWLIILPIGAGLVWIALEGLECGCMPHGISSFLLGLLPIAVGSLLTVRRLAFHSYLCWIGTHSSYPLASFECELLRFLISASNVSGRLDFLGWPFFVLPQRGARSRFSQECFPTRAATLLWKFLELASTRQSEKHT
jgi:hypothetical protein